MKLFAALCFCLLLLAANGENILTQEEQSKLDAVHYTCALGTDVQYNYIMNALKKIYIADEDLVKYFQCVFRLFGFVNKAGEIEIDSMKARIPSQEKNREYIEKAIDKCDVVDATSTSEIAYEFFKCFRNSTNFAVYWNF